jgi:PAS domain S-box-containing protein
MQHSSGPDYAALFQAASSPSLVLDPALRIVDANRAYLQATGRQLSELVGRHMFEAFPDNPADPEADGVANLNDSLQLVLRTRQRHSMWVQKYDVPSDAGGGGFTEKFWSPVNTPIVDSRGELIGILHEVEDVTPFREDLARALDFYSREASSPAAGQPEINRRFGEYAAVSMANSTLYRELAAEVQQLRDAMTSRAVIDRAIGIVMAERRCGADKAFRSLVELSQSANVKLRDVAGALVYRANGGSAPLLRD